ncbi:MAG: hypothetical protein GYB50_20520 [Rhodobacteraceae bacterium]|nr:hypothetical protein [Paracoccaceae bacterium]
MAQELKMRRGTTAMLDASVGGFAEMQVDTTTKEIRVFNGEQLGGYKVGRKPADNVAEFIASQEGSWGNGAVRQAAQHFYEETSDSDALVSNGASVKFHVIPGPKGLDVSACGADRTAVVACDDIVQAAADYASKKGYGLNVPDGVYTLEKGVYIRGSETIAGYKKHMDFTGSGENSCVFVTRNAPDYAFRIDARYVRLRNIRVMGSIDEIRDSDHSAQIGIWVENMREGALQNVKVEHIVGPGIQIDKCIVTRMEGVIVYRCGDATRPAIYQTDAAQDGFQASWLQASVEDAVGPIGGAIFASHRNSHFEVKLENQAQIYVEIGSPSGQALKGETVTFSGGTTGVVALTSNNPATSVHGNAQLVLEDVSGAIVSGETFNVTVSNGTDPISNASGTVKVTPTLVTGPQFKASGDYGTFDIYANQNALKDVSGGDGDIIFACSDSHITKAQVRGPHVGFGIVVSGARNKGELAYTDQGLTTLGDAATRDMAFVMSGPNNVFDTVRGRNCKGIDLPGSRCRVTHLDQSNVWGRTHRSQGNYSGVMYADVQQQAELAETGSVCAGIGSFYGTSGGSVSFAGATGDGITVSGEAARVGPIHLTNMGAATYGIRLTGADSSVEGAQVTVAATKTGIQNTAARGRVVDCKTSGGAVGIVARAAGGVIRGNKPTGYTTRGIEVNPSSAGLEGFVVADNYCYAQGAGATADILIGDDANKSHIINNNVAAAVGAIALGAGTGHVTTGNIT